VLDPAIAPALAVVIGSSFAAMPAPIVASVPATRPDPDQSVRA
jgi:hypothetical protein